MVAAVTAPTLVFDGACGMCRNAVAFLQARLGRGRLDFQPCQEVGAILEELGEAPDCCMEEALLLVPRKNGGTSVLRGAAAVNGALRSLRAGRAVGWRVLGGLYLIPGVGWVQRVAYRWVARNRHRHVFQWLGRAR